MSPDLINGLIVGPAAALGILLYLHLMDKKSYQKTVEKNADVLRKKEEDRRKDIDTLTAAHKLAIDTLTAAHEKTIAELTVDLKAEREHNQRFGEAWMALATETKMHLEHAPSAVKELGDLVKDEHQETRKTIVETHA